MIIKCNKCETTYRFEEGLVTGEGVWVRCTRCWNVFFQENRVPETEAIAHPVSPADEEDRETGEILLAEAGQKDLEEIEYGDNGADPFGEIPVVPKIRTNMGKIAGATGKVFAYIFLLFATVILLSGVYFWIVPESRQQAADFLAPYFPGIRNLVPGMEPGPIEVPAARIMIQDLRQHFVNNWFSGNLWVVEGSVVNGADYPVTNVELRGRLYGSQGNILGEKVVLCGNRLTDSELTTLTEEDIQKRLSQQQDRISPNQQIPFMIVLPREQDGVVKTTVMVVAADRLLE